MPESAATGDTCDDVADQPVRVGPQMVGVGSDRHVVAATRATAAGLSWLWPHYGRSEECPHRDRHRGPEGPNEDLAQCGGCGSVSYSMRPPGESFGWHNDDCSLPVDHESYCKPGGSGHAPAETIRGYWPRDPRSEDFRG